MLCTHSSERVQTCTVSVGALQNTSTLANLKAAQGKQTEPLNEFSEDRCVLRSSDSSAEAENVWDLNYTDLAEMLVLEFHVTGMLHILLAGLPFAVGRDVPRQLHKSMSLSDFLATLHNVRSSTKENPVVTRFDMAAGRHYMDGPCWHLLLAADGLVKPRTGFITILDYLDKYERSKAWRMFYYVPDRVYSTARRSDQPRVCFFTHDEGVQKMYSIDVAETMLGPDLRDRSYSENQKTLSERLVNNVNESESGELRLNEDVVEAMLYTATYLYSLHPNDVKQKHNAVHDE